MHQNQNQIYFSYKYKLRYLILMINDTFVPLNIKTLLFIRRFVYFYCGKFVKIKVIGTIYKTFYFFVSKNKYQL